MTSILEDWFDAFARGDLERARRLLAEGAAFHVLGDGDLAGDYEGFDGIQSLVEKRRALSGGSFAYEVHDLLENERHGVALITLHATVDGVTHGWKQVAVYELSGGRIKDIWAFEEPGGVV